MYYGNIDAQQTQLTESKQFRKKMEILSVTEKELLQNLKCDDLARFEEYIESLAFVNSESVRDSFKTGFKLGAKLIFDIFAD